MKLRQTKLLKLILFICCTVSFLISLKLFWDLGVFCDEFGTSPDEVCGGEFGLFMVLAADGAPVPRYNRFALARAA